MRPLRSLRGADPGLLLILLTAAVLRVWGLDFGLPFPGARPDEEVLLEHAMRLGSGDYSPPHYRYPTLVPYLLFAVLGARYVLGRLSGEFASSLDFGLAYKLDPGHFHLLARSISATFGVLTVLATYHLARRVGGRGTARLAALMLAVLPLHVRDSHFGTTDVTATFFLVLAILFLAGAQGSKRVLPFALAGVSAGLATSAKYVGLMIPAVPLAWSALEASLGRRPWTRLIDRHFLVFVLCMGLGLLLGMPRTVIDLDRIANDFLLEREHLREGHNIDLGIGWWHHARFTLWHGAGFGVLAAALLGGIALARRNASHLLLLMTFPVLYYLAAGSGRTVFARYMLPVLPFLCVLAGLGLSVLSTSMPARWRRPGLVVSAAAVLLLPAARSLETVRLFSRADTRELAAAWILEHVAPGSTIGTPFRRGHYVQLPPDAEDHRRIFDRLRSESPGWERSSQGRILRRMIERAERPGFVGYRQVVSDESLSEFRHTDGLACLPGPDVLVIAASPLYYESYATEGAAALSADYSLVHRIDPARAPIPASFFDQQDRLYLPYRSGSGAERPGPTILIYRRRSSER